MALRLQNTGFWCAEAGLASRLALHGRGAALACLPHLHILCQMHYLPLPEQISNLAEVLRS